MKISTSSNPGEKSATERCWDLLGREFGWLFTKRPHPDNEFRKRYCTLISGHHRSLQAALDNSLAKAEVAQILEKKDTATWEELYRLESLMIQLEPEHALRRHAWLLRSEYQELVSEEEWREYQESKETEETNDANAISLLRADLARLQEEIHWHYTTLWAFEDYRSKAVHSVVKITSYTGGFLLVGIEAAWLYGKHLPINVSVLLSIMTAGWLGGLISTLRRIHAAKLEGNPDQALAKMKTGRLSISISPALGSFFALVLFFLFCFDALKLDLIPDATLGWVSNYDQPTPPTLTGKEFAKLMIWSFIAGFFETFVPDNLKRIANKE